MFPADSIPARYFEEREAAEAAKRLARLQEQQIKGQAPATRPNSSLSQVFAQQRSEMSSPSPSVLGSIFQGFVRATSQSPSDKSCTSGASTPSCQTPSTKPMTQADIEAAMDAERKKEVDIVSFRAW